MSQCVPSWELDENPTPSRLTLRSHSNNSTVPDVPMLDYEVAELTWENGQLAMHGLGPPRGLAAAAASAKAFPPSTIPPSSKATWGDKPRACGTLESIVNQATHRVKPLSLPYGSPTAVDELVTWLDDHRAAAAAAAVGGGGAALAMDALVPCSKQRAGSGNNNNNNRVMSAGVMDCSTRVGSCSGRAGTREAAAEENGRRKAARVAEWSGRERDQSASGSATFGRDSRHVTLDTCERDLGLGGFTSTTSFGSHEDYTSSGKPGGTNKTFTADENDSSCHSRPQRESGGGDDEKKKGNGKSSVSTKRSRAAAIHNQSERRRRDKINQRMKTLQKLVPNSSKSDKASMLDEVIEYLKQLQAQVQMMNRMNMQPMMLPMAMQQQLQMSMMTPMGMGLGMGMGMGMLDMSRPNMAAAGIPPVLHPTAFMPGMGSWDPSSATDRMQSSAPATLDPLSAFLACQSQQQPMTMDAYSRIAALYQQLQQQQQQPPGSSSKN